MRRRGRRGGPVLTASLLRHAAGPAAVGAATLMLRPIQPNLADVALTYLLAVLLASVVGGLWSGAATAILGTLAFNYFFLPPTGTLTIGAAANWFAFVAFLAVAAVTSQLVAGSRARSAAAEGRADRMRALLDLSERILERIAGAGDPRRTLGELAGDFAHVLGADRAAILRFRPGGECERCEPSDGSPWPEAVMRDILAACPAPPKRPQNLEGPLGQTVLVLPLARRSANPALLLASFPRGAPPLAAGLADAVAGLGSLAIERLFLLRRLLEAERVRESDAFKTVLLSSVSHELRTPLAAMRVSATALQRPEAWSDGEVRSELLHTLDEEAERLNRVIANLLCMSRIESGPLALDRAPCEVDALVWEAMRQAGRRLDGGRVRVALPEGMPEVDCDLGLAGTALANLLDNAAKYSPRDRPIDIGGRIGEGGRWVAVWVDDQGPGVVPGESERIFERFYRGRGAAPGGGASGTGLGLSIARALVQAHGGHVWVEPRPGGGSRFTSTWPACVPQGGGSPPTAVEPAAAVVK